MALLIWLLMSLNAKALNLEVVDVQYRLPPQGVSCGLLQQREKERLKVIRELSHLTRKIEDRRNIETANAEYNYLLKKIFMPREDWAEESTEVVISTQPSQELLEQIEHKGLESVFLVTRGPGFVWQSFADQLPPQMSVSVTSTQMLEVRYATYLNAVCNPELKPLSIEWIPSP